MRNRTLSVTRGSIPYVKELRPLAKSVVGCIIMQQLDYWFDKYPDGFFKFLEACASPRYKPGQSWCEETGCSAEEFITAFERVGVRYKSKTSFEAADDKFGGLFYCSYFDRGTGLTYYLRNHDLLDAELDKLTVRETGNPGLRETGKSGLRKPATPVSVNRQSRIPETGNPGLDNKDSETTEETTQRTHTHTSAERSSGEARGVCVTFEDFLAYARTQEWIKNPDGWARSAFRERRHEDVQTVEAFLKTRAAALEEGVQPVRAHNLMSFPEAVRHADSILSTGAKTDLEGLISLLNADDSVKNQLRAHYLAPKARDPAA